MDIETTDKIRNEKIPFIRELGVIFIDTQSLNVIDTIQLDKKNIHTYKKKLYQKSFLLPFYRKWKYHGKHQCAIIAHNGLNFDFRILAHHWLKNKLSKKALLSISFIDSLQIIKYNNPAIKCYTNSYIYKFYTNEICNEKLLHTAYYDCLILKDWFLLLNLEKLWIWKISMN